MFRNRNLAIVWLLTVIVLLPLTSTACEIWYEDNEFRSGYQGSCSLAELFENEFDLDIRFDATQPTLLPSPLPNLHISKFRYSLEGTQLKLSAEIHNVGQVDAQAFSLVALVNVMTIQGRIGSAHTFSRFLKTGLTANSYRTEVLGTISLPDADGDQRLDQDYDIVVIGYIDPPPSDAGPSSGVVWESDETDNDRTETCRVYGPEPDFTVPACN